MPRSPRHPVSVRNVKDERPKTYSFDDAVNMLRQGYALERVVERTGFPAAMLTRDGESGQGIHR